MTNMTNMTRPGVRPVSAVIYTIVFYDHYGGRYGRRFVARRLPGLSVVDAKPRKRQGLLPEPGGMAGGGSHAGGGVALDFCD